MFPIRDENPTLRPPVATYVILGMNLFVWIFVQGLGFSEPLGQSICLYGLIPADLLGTTPAGAQIPLGGGWVCRLDGNGSINSLITSMFMHGSWLHIIGNMLFLWVFGDNVEDVMGPGRFLLFYLLCGLAAAGAQIAADPTSVVPMVGASGAIGGVMGAYAIVFPRARVHLLIILIVYVTTISVPAIFMLGYWFILQLIAGVGSLGAGGGGVAFWAHIGGFVAGVGLISLFKRADLMAARKQLGKRPAAKHRLF
ncbi:MAG: rhomboid family intramembrane serine protease [bacterium]